MDDTPFQTDGFEAAFDAMLAGDEDVLAPWLRSDPRGQAALAVYRNTVAKARVDALAGLFPTVERLVGRDWFRQAALMFAAASPPSSPVLDAYGSAFPEWLSTFPPALDLPYLAPVARLDQAWSQAHRAPDAPALSGRVVRETAPARLFASRVEMHPSVRLFWFDWTVPTIWIANRADPAAVEDVAWEARAEGLLIVRSANTVTWRRLPRSEWVFLHACQRGRTLGQAALDVLSTEATLDMASTFAGLLTTGAFSHLQPDSPPHD